MKARPAIFKWPGGKSRYASTILPLLRPAITRTLVDPMVGGMGIVRQVWDGYGAVVCADTNEHLIVAYKALADWRTGAPGDAWGKEFCDRQLERFFAPENNTAEMFDLIRTNFNMLQYTSSVDTGLALLYLNRHCYNGLMRFSKAGNFNAPFGHYKNVNVPAGGIKELRRMAQTLGDNLTFEWQDFEQTMAEAPDGSDIVLDPPYTPITATANFTQYTAEGFTPADRSRLIRSVLAASQRQCRVLVFDHDLAETRELHNGARKIVTYKAARNISRDGKTRNKVGEMIAVYGE